MFTDRPDATKAGMHYLLAVAAAILSAVVAPWVGADGAGILTMATPLLAVLLMLLVVTRDGYRQAGWQGMGLHRAGRSAWGLAVLGPLLVLSATYAMVWGSALGHFVWPTEGGVVDLILDLVIGLVVAVGLALAEEIGWRGYFLPHLAGIGRTRALLLSGCLHGCWYLPLMLLTPYYHGDGSRWLIIPRFLLTLTAAGVFYGYLRLTSHSLWPVAVAHGAFNTLWGQFAALTTAGAAPLRLAYLAGESGLLTLVGTGARCVFQVTASMAVKASIDKWRFLV